MIDLTHCWPAERLGEALALLGQERRLTSRQDELAAAPSVVVQDPASLRLWIEEAAARLSLEAEEVDAGYPEVSELIGTAAPALLQVPGPGAPHFLALLGRKKDQMLVLAPDRSRQRLPIQEIRAALCRSIEEPAAPEVEQIVQSSGMSPRRGAAARQALLNQFLRESRVGSCWTLRAAADAGLRTRLREAGLLRLLAVVMATELAAAALFVGSWWILGRMMLGGRMEFGWLQAWLLVLATLIPFRLLASLSEGLVALHAGTMFKRTILRGAMRLESDALRHQGVGQLLGQVIESEVVESTTLAGGFLTIHGAIEMLLAAFVLGMGAGSFILVALLLVCLGLACFWALRNYQCRQAWTDARLAMTGDLVEKLAGHRTRLVQQVRRRWSDGEDHALARYLALSKRLDTLAVAMRVVGPRLWLVFGFAGLAPLFLAGADNATLAIAVGGILLAFQAFRHLASGGEELAAAIVAWKRVEPFWRAAAQPAAIGDPLAAAMGGLKGVARAGETLLTARGIDFRYRDRGAPVLHDLNLDVQAGQRLLLEGSSGAGKSSLAAILAGTRQPSAGLVLLGGLDRESLGAAAWSRRIVVAPQFHENHVMMGTLAYNALLGRDWPPTAADLREAERILRGLKLDELLKRMPAGIYQTVGETGWQLSHGERSRLFVARTLLQRSDLIILDESFAALDPETLADTMKFVLDEAATLMVIAHP